jgi:pilus assembly protein Flp/PilA
MLSPWRKLDTESGQGLVEYALILLLMAVVVVAGLTLFGVSVNSLYTTIAGLP